MIEIYNPFENRIYRTAQHSSDAAFSGHAVLLSSHILSCVKFRKKINQSIFVKLPRYFFKRVMQDISHIIKYVSSSIFTKFIGFN